eukprot:5580847-Amphidinium_carterae.1
MFPHLHQQTWHKRCNRQATHASNEVQYPENKMNYCSRWLTRTDQDNSVTSSWDPGDGVCPGGLPFLGDICRMWCIGAWHCFVKISKPGVTAYASV